VYSVHCTARQQAKDTENQQTQAKTTSGFVVDGGGLVLVQGIRLP